MDIQSSLLPKRLSRAEYERGNHFLEVPKGVPVAAVVDPDFWQHVAARLHVNDRIEVLSPDFDLDLRVVALDSRKLWAQVRVLRLCDAAGLAIAGAEPLASPAVIAGAPDTEGYIVEWGGPKHLWRIVYGGNLIDKGFHAKSEADARLAEIKAPKVAA